MERRDPEAMSEGELLAKAADNLPPARFFAADEILSSGATITLGEDVAHHARVRRLGVGETVGVLDGSGRIATATIVRVAKSALAVEVVSVTSVAALPPVHMLVPIADRERMLWLAEKATELALTSWRPVTWKYSRSVKPRGEGQQFVAKVLARMASALEQSGGAWLPTLYPDATVERAAASAPEGIRLVLDRSGPSILRLPLVAPVTIAVGPEGGFTPAELEALVSRDFRPVSVGASILRFETAAVAALAIVRAALDSQVLTPPIPDPESAHAV